MMMLIAQSQCFLYPEMVPTGGMPRHVRVVVDRALVDRVSPGNRVCVVGVPSLQVIYSYLSPLSFLLLLAAAFFTVHTA